LETEKVTSSSSKKSAQDLVRTSSATQTPVDDAISADKACAQVGQLMTTPAGVHLAVLLNTVQMGGCSIIRH